MPKVAIITGGGGFLGQYLINRILIDTDWLVLSLDVGSIPHKGPRVQSAPIKLSVETVHFCNLLLSDWGSPSYVFHLAAMADVGKSIEDPWPTVYNNVSATCAALEIARRYRSSLECFVNFSSYEVFGECNHVAPTAASVHRPRNPYAASKSASDNLVDSYAASHGVPTRTVYSVNLIGREIPPTKFIPICADRVRNKKPIFVNLGVGGDPGSRMYLPAREAARALLFLANAGPGEPVGLPGRSLTNLEIPSMVGEILKRTPIIQTQQAKRLDGCHAIQCDLLDRMGFRWEDCFLEEFESSVVG